ncbi:MAG: GatB/YqeY domain-containing protein [Candidatus Omnitrophota bacterium]
MALYKRIEEDAKEALKKNDPVRLSVLRMVIAAIRMLEIEKKSGPVADDDILAIVQRQIKQHKESIEQFTKGNRQDLVDKEAKELAILQSYMPAQLPEEEVLKIIKDAIAETGAAAKSDAGKVIKAVMAKAKGRADGKTVNQLVMGLLK